jgi:glutaconyl-CoA/methylmalonyl-CoA decarboxylase subunit gamma
MRKFLIKVNGNNYEVEVDELNENTSKVQQPLQTVSSVETRSPVETTKNQPVQTKTVSTSTEKTVPQGAATIVAPMPGTVLSININVGDSVKKGQVLLILEAMKMENEITASLDGRIASVNINEGVSVNAGDVLVSIS